MEEGYGKMVDMTLEVPSAKAPRLVQQIYRMKLAINKCLAKIECEGITEEASARQEKKAIDLMNQIDILELEAKAVKRRDEVNAGVNINVPLGHFGLASKTPE